MSAPESRGEWLSHVKNHVAGPLDRAVDSAVSLAGAELAQFGAAAEEGVVEFPGGAVRLSWQAEVVEPWEVLREIAVEVQAAAQDEDAFGLAYALRRAARVGRVRLRSRSGLAWLEMALEGLAALPEDWRTRVARPWLEERLERGRTEKGAR